jgi:Gpi18-like mannosyltransferase
MPALSARTARYTDRMTISPTLREVAPRAALIWLVTRLVDTLLTLLGPSGFMSWYFWDGGFYWGIAKQGYLPGNPWQAAYFPLYPLLIRSGMLLAPEVAAALLVSSLAFLAALFLVGMLADGAWAPMLLLAASPLAFFFTGMYADGLFLALVSGALLAYQRERWALCGILLGLSCVTRPFAAAGA